MQAAPLSPAGGGAQARSKKQEMPESRDACVPVVVVKERNTTNGEHYYVVKLRWGTCVELAL